jgi:alpha-glucosidase
VSVLTKTIFRFRYAIKGEFQHDFSYAIDENFNSDEPAVQFEEEKEYYKIFNTQLNCFISKKGMKVRMEASNGNVICEDDKGFRARTTILKGIDNVSISKKTDKKESFFGLGDKSSSLNLRGQQFENWNTDSFLYNEKTDPLYRTIPFYYGLKNGVAYGIFMDNSYRSRFDFDSKRKGNVEFSASGGEMNYYFFYGPELLSVARHYVQLTGKPNLPPIWALGFHQCCFSYYPESKVREVANEFRNRQIPCDAIYLDIDYMDGFRCFTWDKKHFPKPSEMVKDLRQKGFKTIVMIDPGLKEDENYDVFKEGKERGYFCKRPDGDLMIGPVWPSDCAFPDFTNRAVRSWWGHLYRTLYSKDAIAGFWNDMNEPSVFKIEKRTFPENVLHYFEGQTASHARIHNVYGMQMSRATFEGLLKLKNHRRPFVITRATYSGGQRYASVWTGDNTSSWKHLKIANIQCQRMSISGFSFVGSDVGGFAEQTTGELMVRWLQLGVFHPLFRVHSIGENSEGDVEISQNYDPSINSKDQEPWSFGADYTSFAKYAIELRYQLLPYIYTAFWQYTQDGVPMIKSLSFYAQGDPKAVKNERDFIFGNQLMISPIIKKGKTKQKLYLPEGQWYHYWSANMFEGNQNIEINAPLSQIPIFIKSGSVIPHYPIQQYTDEKPVDEITLHVYYKNGKETSQLYEDAGDGFEYKNEVCSIKDYEFVGSEKEIILNQHKKGQWIDTYHTCNVLFYGLPFQPKNSTADGEEVDCKEIEIRGNKVYIFTLENSFQQVILKP